MANYSTDEWIAWGTQFARKCLRSAREWAANGDPQWCRADLKSAMHWTIEAWLRKSGHEPDNGNGWHSQLNQFVELAPQEVSDPLLRPFVMVVLAETLPWGQMTPEELADYFDFEKWGRPTADAVEKLLANDE